MKIKLLITINKYKKIFYNICNFEYTVKLLLI